MIKPASELVAAANAAVKTIDVEQAKAQHGTDGVLFLDVREPQEVAQGRIPGSLAIPRGLLEFQADPNSPMHRPELSEAKEIVVYCASGGRSALAAKALKDMGYPEPVNMLGGFQKWQSDGGEVER